jgi:hypothetical protein
MRQALFILGALGIGIWVYDNLVALPLVKAGTNVPFVWTDAHTFGATKYVSEDYLAIAGLGIIAYLAITG